jgi:hypothetical protein
MGFLENDLTCWTLDDYEKRKKNNLHISRLGASPGFFRA